MDQKLWLEQNTVSLAGNTVVLTGATGGLGRELSRAILFCGGELVLVARDPGKAAALADQLLQEFPKGSIRSLQADLADIDSVRKLADTLKEMPVDILIHNAGAYSIPRMTCSTGYDNVFQINFISPYYLTKQLLPVLQKRRGKVVAVGSIAHNYSKSDPFDVDFATRSAASKVYGNSKRYLMFALMGLLKDSGVRFAIGHPGITFTNITAHYPKLIFSVIKYPMKIIFMKPAAASRSVMQALCRKIPAQCWVGPRYFEVWGNPSVAKLHTCSQKEQTRICAAAEAIYDGIVHTADTVNP